MLSLPEIWPEILRSLSLSAVISPVIVSMWHLNRNQQIHKLDLFSLSACQNNLFHLLGYSGSKLFTKSKQQVTTLYYYKAVNELCDKI